MRTPFARRFGALVCLASLLFSRASRAADFDVHIDGDADMQNVEVLDRTDESTNVYVGRYAVPRREFVYKTICASLPCDVRLAEGPHHLALARRGGTIVDSNVRLDLHSATSLTASYDDRTGYRATGLLVLLGTAFAGTALAVSSKKDDYSGQVDETKLAAGLGLLLGGAILSIPLLAMGDKASIAIGPASLGGAGVAKQGPALPNGLALSVSF